MSNIPFEPKDGDYVSLIEKLGKTSIDEIKDEIARSQKEHQQHAGVLNSPSIEKSISQKNQNRSPAQAYPNSTAGNRNTAQNYTKTVTIDTTSPVQKVLKVLLFIGFLFAATITGFIALTVDTEDEEIILFPMVIYVIFVAVVSSKLSKRKNTKEK